MSLSQHISPALRCLSACRAQQLMLYPCNGYIMPCYAFTGAQSGDTGLDWFAMGTQNEVRDVGGIGNKAYKRQQACAWSCEPEIPPSPQNSFGVQDSLFFPLASFVLYDFASLSCGVDFFVSGTSSI